MEYWPVFQQYSALIEQCAPSSHFSRLITILQESSGDRSRNLQGVGNGEHIQIEQKCKQHVSLVLRKATLVRLGTSGDQSSHAVPSCSEPLADRSLCGLNLCRHFFRWTEDQFRLLLLVKHLQNTSESVFC